MTAIQGGVRDPRVRDYVDPVRVVWTSGKVENAESLLSGRDGQATLQPDNPCIIRSGEEPAGLLLDFGRELHGGVQLAAWNVGGNGRNARVRVRFGESAMEAMSELGGATNATNDHAVRDQIVTVPFLGASEIGNTGFRFVRIDLEDPDSFIELKAVRAVFLYRDLPYEGSFRSSDPLLDRIWLTGAYTVHLNMQEYVWDGIKRDRLVWIGDMHPETSVIQAVFAHTESVRRSLDLIRDATPLPGWMNGFPSYSIWWLLIHHDWYMHHGDREYLEEQRTYLLGLLELLRGQIDESGACQAPNAFLDWPSTSNPDGVRAGIHALFALAMQRGAALCALLGEEDAARLCGEAEERLRSNIPPHADSKQAAALLALAGLMEPEDAAADVIAVGGSRGVSTFYGFYMLNALAEAGDIRGALACIREYWGAMLELGATTFWEDFDLAWTEDAARIDELTPPGKIDVHGTYGAHCYIGYRHSLCHGWAAGPTAWLSRYVLGIEIAEPGCGTLRIRPRLGDLEWAEGAFPTPLGTVAVRHERQADGSVRSEVRAPEGMRVILEETAEVN